VANTHRNVEARPEPYLAQDFIYWSKDEASGSAADEMLELDDPVAQSQLIKAAIFGIKPNLPG
jgi:hypothetical protein